MFDANSENSVRDLANSLQEDASPVMVTMLKDLFEELSAQSYLPMVRVYHFLVLLPCVHLIIFCWLWFCPR